MKTLYISDLDGTLLNDNAQISRFSKNELSRMTDKGVNFSVATARTSATVLKMLEGTGINVPIVLMNGVCIYDIQNSRYIKVDRISNYAKRTAQQILADFELFGFWYSIKDEFLKTYFVKAGSSVAKGFIREREKLGKKFTKIERFSECLDEPLVYYSICDKKEKIEAAAGKLRNVHGLRIEFYRDTYIDNYWYLEICADSASKRNAINFLRNEYGFDKVIGFGDNFNDLPMFQACEESCAVSNAVTEVKSKATFIIDSNNEDGVVKWLARETSLR